MLKAPETTLSISAAGLQNKTVIDLTSETTIQESDECIVRSEHAYGKLRYKIPKQGGRVIDYTSSKSTSEHATWDDQKALIDCHDKTFSLESLSKIQDFEPAQPTDQLQLLQYCFHTLNASPTARAMIADAVKQGWNVQLAEHNDYDYTLDSSNKTIILDCNGLDPVSLASSAYFTNTLLVALIKSLRDVWQDKRNSGYENLFNPESILLLERVRTADICAVGVLVAWELRSEGYGDIWRHMIGSDDGDLAMAFSSYLEREPCATFTHHALAVTFQQWFKNEDRVGSCDHETLDLLDALISRPNHRPFGKKSPTHIAVELFSCLPDRTAYLHGDGSEILRDPLYSGLNDPVNQAHLFQILHDAQAVFAGGVPFRNADLAARIFPQGTVLDTVEEHL